MIFNSYKNKLIVTFIMIAIIPIIIFSAIVNLTVKKHIINQGVNEEIQFVNNKAEEINMWFSDKEKMLKAIVNDYVFYNHVMDSDADFLEVSKYLSNLVENLESFINIYITMEDGREYNSTLLIDEIDTRTRSWYINTIKAGDIVWSQPYKDLITGNMIMTVSLPIRNEMGKIQGVLGADLSTEEIFKELGKIIISDKFTTYIMNSKNEIVSFFGKDILQSNGLRNNFSLEIESFNPDILDEKNNGKIIKLDKEYFVAYSTIPKVGWKLVCFVEKRIFYENITELNKYIITILIITLIIVISLALLLSSRYSKPLEKLKEGTLELYKGNYDYRISAEKNNEIGELAKAFNRAAEELGRTYKKLDKQTKMLIDSNKQLQDMNVELEASYEQLQAMTKELNESEEKYRLLVENMNDLVWYIGSNYRIIFVNDKIKDMLKYDKTEVLGKDIREFLSNIWYFEDKEGINDNIKNDIFERLSNYDYKSIRAILKSKDGKKITGEINTKRIYEGGKLKGIHVVIRDITKRKKLHEQILRKNREFFTINKISENLNSTMNLNKLLEMVVDDIVDLMKTPLCTIRLLTEDGKLKLMAYSGELTDIIRFDDIPLEESIKGVAVRERKIVKINYMNDDNNISQYDKKILRNENANYENIFPLIVREKVLGVLVVVTKTDLTKSQTTILTSLANQAAMIIENTNLYNGLKESYMKTIKALAAAVEAKDKYTKGHSYRVSKYSHLIAKHMGLSDKICEEIEIGGNLHDIGKIGIKDSILIKPGKLTEEEFNEIKKHPIIGSKILENVGFSDVVMNSIKYHHKRYDLKGYPKEGNLERLPLEACIVGVADALDAMASSRSYRKAMSIENAVNELVKNKGTQFHPDVVDALVDIYNKNPEIIIEISKIFCD